MTAPTVSPGPGESRDCTDWKKGSSAMGSRGWTSSPGLQRPHPGAGQLVRWVSADMTAVSCRQESLRLKPKGVQGSVLRSDGQHGSMQGKLMWRKCAFAITAVVM
jgi:hypothetical protein